MGSVASNLKLIGRYCFGKTRQWRRSRAFIRWVIALSTVVILVVSTGIYLNSRLKEIILQEINQQLLVKVQVKEISASVFRHFPAVSMQFDEIIIPSASKGPRNLVEANRLTVQFSLLDILRKRYIIRNIELSDGKLNLIIPEKGTPNYLILKEGDAEGESVSIALKKVLVRQMGIHYHDKGAGQMINLYATKTQFKGNFSSSFYQLSARGSFKTQKIQVGSDPFFSGQDTWIDVILDVDNNKKLYTIRRGKIEISGLPFTITGSVCDKAELENMDLKIQGDHLLIEHLFDLLPTGYKEMANQYTPSGGITFQGEITGGYTQGRSPTIQFDFGIQQGRIVNNATDYEIHDMDIRGTFLHDQGESSLQLSELRASIGDGLIRGVFSMVDFNHPRLKINLEADLIIDDMVGLLPEELLIDGEGAVKGKLMVETRLSINESWSISQLLDSKINGQLIFSNASLSLPKQKNDFSGIQGVLVFDNNDVKVNHLNFVTGKSDGQFTGYFRNLIPYLLLENQKLECIGSLKSSYLDLQDVLFSNTDNAKSGSGEIHLPTEITGYLDVNIDQTNYQGFSARSISGRINLATGKVYAENIRMLAFHGIVSGSALLSQYSDKGLGLDVEMNMRKTMVNQIFKQFDNFGQNDLKDDNLKGILTGRFRFFSRLTSGLKFELPTIEAIGDISIEDGALLHYEPVEALSKYTGIKDLSDIRFNTLKNEIRIFDQKVIIPEMMIRSNALDLSLSGTQTFAGNIEYHLKLRLSELISNRLRKDRSGEKLRKESEYDHAGRMNLHLVMEGTVDNPVVKYDRKGHMEKLKEELGEERKETRDLLKKEMSTFNQSEGDQRNRKESREEKILIEWDE